MKTLTINRVIKSLAVAGLLLSSTAVMANDGGSLYKKCSACHGMSAEKKALGKSKVVNAMTQEEIVTAMNGYKDGTYGGPMKGLMKGQVAKLSADDINSLASYIVTLK